MRLKRYMVFNFRKLLTLRRGRQTWLGSNYYFMRFAQFYAKAIFVIGRLIPR